jgi:SagB-type dehydrogenase family enzyme
MEPNTLSKAPAAMSDTAPDPAPLVAYHQRTKHRFEAFAEGPGQLDWDAQPAAFRLYPGAPVFELPLAGDRFERPFGQLNHPPEQAVTPNMESLGALLELGLGISAWKSHGASRWALRCNPSSGNLHPVEAYVLSSGLPGVPAGLHHYDPEAHALEGRALIAPDDGQWLAIGLTSVMWREAWKYGERAFRYCQLDIGHAVAALAYAAGLLGWGLVPLALPGATLARLLGVDRSQDFPPTRFAFTEAEEPEMLLAVRAPGLGPVPLVSLADRLAKAHWQGSPSCIDPAPGYRWPAVSHAAAASRVLSPPDAAGQGASALPMVAGDGGDLTAAASVSLPGVAPSYPPLPPHPAPFGAAALIRQRRSGQRFDPTHTLDKGAFYRMLDAVLPRPQVPFTLQEAAPALHLLLFVLRVDGLPTGLYLLPRTPWAAQHLPAMLGGADASWGPPSPVAPLDPQCPPHLNLVLLAALERQAVQRLARSLSCHQDIAATGAFSLGMLGDFSGVAADGAQYRRLLREAGLMGQVLYLEAEAAGVRGTGIGCFFDDPVHQAFGVTDGRWQSVYHFTVGTPVVDSRIETSLPYPQRSTQSTLP